LTKGEYEFIYDVIREENPVTAVEKADAYTKEDFLGEVYMTENKYNTLVSVLKNKKNIILQGAPGVGKTFAARRLAWSIMGVKDDERVEFVQFHQSYSYEDFIMGYKPAGDGFALEKGLFYNFCLKAKSDPTNDYFFIIDEINRGNMSKIFGELLMLVENDYRGTDITLAYDKKPFSVPRNLYIIGMMNTADRSLAMIDYALRRRFSFVEMVPGFDSEGFEAYQTTINNNTFNKLIGRVKALNADIENDASLGKGFCIGHSYFCGLEDGCTDAVLKEIVDYDIIPMLEEYWFDDEAKAKNWSNDLSGVFNG
jgi:5-methylcytosine-specific restriction protein B